MPYAGMTTKQVAEELRNRTIKLESPSNLPDWLLPVFRSCLDHNETSRPSFQNVATSFKVCLSTFKLLAH